MLTVIWNETIDLKKKTKQTNRKNKLIGIIKKEQFYQSAEDWAASFFQVMQLFTVNGQRDSQLSTTTFTSNK